MTVIDEAPARNGSVVDSQRPPLPAAATTPSAPGAASMPSGPRRGRRRKQGRSSPRLRSATDGSQRLHSDLVMAEADAAAKRAERFFVGWLVVATAISIVANVAHAWLTAPADIRLGAAIASLVPPVVLLVQTHAVFMLIKARRFGWAFFISLVVTILIAAGAFVLSYESIRVLVIKLGTSPGLAGLWPAIIDLSIVGCTVALYALTRTGPHAIPETEAEPGVVGGGEVGERASIGIDLKSLSLTERVMMWDRAASVVKERNPEVRAITERSTSEIADVLRLTHDERANQRTIADRLGLNDRIVRTIQRAGQDVLGRTDPGALQLD
jgi:hypothetical protein